MIIDKDGKIKKMTENELFEYWLKRWSDLYPYNEYRRIMIEKGVVIIDDNK